MLPVGSHGDLPPWDPVWEPPGRGGYFGKRSTVLSTGDSGETELVDSRGDRRWIPALRWDHDLPETRAE